MGECAKIATVEEKQIQESEESEGMLNLVGQSFNIRSAESAMDQVDSRRKLGRPVSVVEALTDQKIDRLERLNVGLSRRRFLFSTNELSFTSDVSDTPSGHSSHMRGTAEILEQLAAALGYLDISTDTMNKTAHAARALAELAARNAYEFNVDSKGTPEKLAIDGINDPPAARPPASSKKFMGTIAFETSNAPHPANIVVVSPIRSETFPISATSSTSASPPAATPSFMQNHLSSSSSCAFLPGAPGPQQIRSPMFSSMWNTAAMTSTTTSSAWPQVKTQESRAKTVLDEEATSAPSSPTQEMHRTLANIKKNRCTKREPSNRAQKSSEEPAHVHVDSDLIELYSTTPDRESLRNRFTGTVECI